MEFYGVVDNIPMVCEAIAQKARADCLKEIALVGAGCTLICIGFDLGSPVAGIVCHLACIGGDLYFAPSCEALYSAKLSSCINCYVQCLFSGRSPY